MAGPVIRHDELFDFESYFASIKEAKDSTIELAKILNKISDSTNNNLAESLGKLKGMKVSVASEKDLETLKAYNEQIDQLGTSVNNYRNTAAGISKTNTSVADSIAAVEAETKQLVKEIKNLSEEDRKNEAIGGQKIKRLAELKTATSQFTDTVKTTTKTLSAAENSYNQLSNELLQLKNQLKNLPNAFDSTTGAINQQNQEAVKLSKRIGEVDKSIKTMDATMGTFNRNVGNYEGATVSLRQQLKGLREEIGRMQLAGEQNTEAYNQLVEKAGELADTLSDVSAEIKRVGSDTATIEGLVGVFEGVASAAAIAEGTTALFGSENDDLVESIQKLQAVQTVLMGIQGIANMLQKESAAVLFVVNTQRKLETLYTHLQTAAESKSIIVRKAAAAAQWMLNIAMKANPVGLLIAAVALLAGAVLLLTRRSERAAEAQVKLNEVQKNYFEMISRNGDKIAEAGQKRIQKIEEELKLAKAQGASEIEIMGIEQKLAEARDQNAAKQKGYWSAEIDNINALQKSYDGYLNYIGRLKSAQALGIKTNVITNFQTSSTESKKVKEVDITAAEGFAENLKTRLDKALKVREEYENAGTDLTAKALEDQRKLIERQWKNRIALDEAVLAKTKEDSAQELNARIKVLRDKRDFELKNVNLTRGEVVRITAETEKEIAELKKEYAEKVAKSEINGRISLIKTSLAVVKEGSDEEYKLKAQLLDEEEKLEILAAKNSINNELEKLNKIKEINAQLLADKKKLEKEKRLAELTFANDQGSGSEQLEIVKNKKILADSKSTGTAIYEARKQIELLNQQSIQREFDFNQKKYDEGLITFEDYEKRKTEIQLEQENLRLSQIEEASQRQIELQQSISQAATESINSITQLFSYAVDNRVSKIEEEKEAAIAAAGENTAARERIEKVFNKKIAAEKRKAAIADKFGALFSIGINTAMGIMNTVAKLGMPAAIPFIVATGILGAAQAAVVAAKPIPKYRRGTDNAPEGLAVVNDEPGPVYQELIVRDKKAYLPSKRNQLIGLRKGDKVIPAYKTARILAASEKGLSIQKQLAHQGLNNSLSEKLDIGRKLEVEHTMINAMMAARVNEKAIGDEVGKHIAGIPQPIHNWDDAGYQKRIRRGNSTITILNKRNSLS